MFSQNKKKKADWITNLALFSGIIELASSYSLAYELYRTFVTFTQGSHKWNPTGWKEITISLSFPLASLPAIYAYWVLNRHHQPEPAPVPIFSTHALGAEDESEAKLNSVQLSDLSKPLITDPPSSDEEKTTHHLTVLQIISLISLAISEVVGSAGNLSSLTHNMKEEITGTELNSTYSVMVYALSIFISILASVASIRTYTNSMREYNSPHSSISSETPPADSKEIEKPDFFSNFATVGTFTSECVGAFGYGVSLFNILYALTHHLKKPDSLIGPLVSGFSIALLSLGSPLAHREVDKLHQTAGSTTTVTEIADAPEPESKDDGNAESLRFSINTEKEEERETTTEQLSSTPLTKTQKLTWLSDVIADTGSRAKIFHSVATQMQKGLTQKTPSQERQGLFMLGGTVFAFFTSLADFRAVRSAMKENNKRSHRRQ